jgi:CheY-like chemotaxis protein
VNEPGGTGGPPAAGEAEGARTVLLIEDNPDVREALRDLLEMTGHSVLEASDGDGGIRMALAHTPDVALVDVGLPGVDGFEVARRIRAAAGTNSVVLVALTGYGGSDLQRRARAAGFDLHLTKPVEMSELEHLLAHLPARP